MNGARAEAIVDAIIADLNGRRGLKLSSCDDEVVAKIRETWIEIVRTSAIDAEATLFAGLCEMEAEQSPGMITVRR